MTDSTHLAGRFAETAGPRQDGAEHDHWGGEPLSPHTRLMHEFWAGEYVRRLRSGDRGQAIAYLHQLRHNPPEGFDIWRFTEAAAGRLTGKDG